MSAGTYDLTIEQGATFSRTITVTENSSPKNLTGWTGRASFKKTYGGSKKADFNVTITDEPNGVLTMSLTADQTSKLSGDGVYDLEIDDGAGTVIRLLQGTVTVSPEVTTT